MNHGITNRRHFPALDGVRGLAIILVVLYHNFGFGNNIYMGWLGVDLFFVLSGYLITGILLDTVGSPGYLGKFYMRRVLRIFPLYYLVLIIFLVVLPALPAFKQELQYYSDNQFWFWFYLQNWLTIFDFPTTTGYLNHFWSLAVEEQFYLVWPFVILWLRRPQRLLVFLLIVLVALTATRSILFSLRLEDFNYTLFYRFTRIDGICVGCIIALLRKIKPGYLSDNMPFIVLALALVNFLFFFLNKANQFSYPYFAFIGYTTFAAMFGLLVNEAASRKSTIITTLFSFAPLRYIGQVSYGFYIFHWPVYLLTHQYFFLFMKNNLHLPDGMSTLGAGLLSTGLALLLSVASYHSLERYFLYLKSKFE